jgi:hypothetical protein
MARFRIPLLGPIELIQDQEIRLYATIGVIISLTAGLELMLLDIFAAGLEINETLAGEILFQAKVGSLQRDMAIVALTARLKDSVLEDEWNALQERLVKATSQNSSRHLLAHNVVRMTYEGEGIGLGAFALGTSALGTSERRFFVEQDHRKVLAGKQKPKKEDFNSLLSFSEELVCLQT